MRKASGQEAARKATRAIVGVEVDVKVARMREQLGKTRLGGREMPIGGSEYADLPDVDVPVREVQVHAHRARQPPDYGPGSGARG